MRPPSSPHATTIARHETASTRLQIVRAPPLRLIAVIKYVMVGWPVRQGSVDHRGEASSKPFSAGFHSHLALAFEVFSFWREQPSLQWPRPVKLPRKRRGPPAP